MIFNPPSCRSLKFVDPFQLLTTPPTAGVKNDQPLSGTKREANLGCDQSVNLIKFQSLIGRDYLLTEKVGESDNADVIVFQKHARMVHNRLGWKRFEENGSRYSIDQDERSSFNFLNLQIMQSYLISNLFMIISNMKRLVSAGPNMKFQVEKSQHKS